MQGLKSIAMVFVGVLLAQPLCAAPKLAPAPVLQNQSPNQSIVLAGGCFWCVESDFDKLDGVISTTSGYAGGTISNPNYNNYHDEGAGIVPHIEVVKIVYNPKKLSYETVLNYYFRHIDPTDGGGQFCDRGPAYRPAIFVGNDADKAKAEAIKLSVAAQLKTKVKVDILPAATFWPAEDYHQNYHTKASIKYNYYRLRCGRDARVKAVWSVVK